MCQFILDHHHPTLCQAWNFCWDLIQQDKKHEVQFFGASCLAVKVTILMMLLMMILMIIMMIMMKVSRCWPELPADQYDGLRQGICCHKYAKKDNSFKE